jgi:hypothetical protein
MTGFIAGLVIPSIQPNHFIKFSFGVINFLFRSSICLSNIVEVSANPQILPPVAELIICGCQIASILGVDVVSIGVVYCCVSGVFPVN